LRKKMANARLAMSGAGTTRLPALVLALLCFGGAGGSHAGWTETFSTIDTSAAGITNGSNAYKGVAAVGGKVYFAPYDVDNVGVFDSARFNFTTLNLTTLDPARQSSAAKFEGAVAVGTKVYFPPRRESAVGVLDTVTSRFSTLLVGGLTATDKYGGGAALGSKLYFAPLDEDHVGMLDTAAWKCRGKDPISNAVSGTERVSYMDGEVVAVNFEQAGHVVSNDQTMQSSVRAVVDDFLNGSSYTYPAVRSYTYAKQGDGYCTDNWASSQIQYAPLAECAAYCHATSECTGFAVQNDNTQYCMLSRTDCSSRTTNAHPWVGYQLVLPTVLWSEPTGGYRVASASWRLLMTGQNANNQEAYLKEIEMYSGDQLVTGSGTASTDCQRYTSQDNVSEAFDGNTNTYLRFGFGGTGCIGNTGDKIGHWVRYDFPAAVSLTKVGVMQGDESGNLVTSYDVQSLDDGVWSTAWSARTETSGPHYRTPAGRGHLLAGIQSTPDGRQFRVRLPRTPRLTVLRQGLPSCASQGCTDVPSYSQCFNWAQQQRIGASYASGAITDPSRQPGCHVNIIGAVQFNLATGQTASQADISPICMCPDTPVPVMILLHGIGGTGYNAMQTALAVAADYVSTHILVAPDGNSNSWNIKGEPSTQNDVQYVGTTLVSHLASFVNVLPTFGLVGFSNGAALSHRILIENDDDRITTAVTDGCQLNTLQYQSTAELCELTLCGSFYFGGSTNAYTTRKPALTPRRVLQIVGGQDTALPANGGQSSISDGQGGYLMTVNWEDSALAYASAYGWSCFHPGVERMCTNTCGRDLSTRAEAVYAFDGDCDDGGAGAEYWHCALGTDCHDCGARLSLRHRLDDSTELIGDADYISGQYGSMFSKINLTAAGVTGAAKYHSATVAGTNVYLGPWDQDNIGVIDTVTSTFSTIDTAPAGVVTDSKYQGAALLGTKIYFAPSGAGKVGVVDTLTSTFSTIAISSENWLCCVGAYDYNHAYSLYDGDVDVSVSFLNEDQLAAVQSTIAVGGGSSSLAVYTDLTFYMQLDDSSQDDSYFRWLNVTSNQVNVFYWNQTYRANHMRVFLSSASEGKLVCRVDNCYGFGGTSDEAHAACCQGLPASPNSGAGDIALDAVLIDARFRPQAGSATNSQWFRNRFSLSGSYYKVSLPGGSCGGENAVACPSSLDPSSPNPGVNADANNKYSGAAAIGTKVYFTPLNQDNVGVVDTVTSTFSTVATDGFNSARVSGDLKYHGATVVGNKMYFGPRNQDNVGVMKFPPSPWPPPPPPKKYPRCSLQSNGDLMLTSLYSYEWSADAMCKRDDWSKERANGWRVRIEEITPVRLASGITTWPPAPGTCAIPEGVTLSPPARTLLDPDIIGFERQTVLDARQPGTTSAGPGTTLVSSIPAGCQLQDV